MSELYPVNIDVDENQIKQLINFFRIAYTKLVDEINGATDFGVANRRAILAQVDEILTKLGDNVQNFVDKNLPGYYKAGADDAIKQLQNIKAGIDVKYGFSELHRDAIVALIDDTVRSYNEAITGIKRSANLLLGKATREMISQEIALGVVSGEALTKVRRQIKGLLEEQGLSALVDKSGKRWSPDAYAEMLFRTKVVEARNMGLTNRMVENNYDLVQVSSHIGSCRQCAPWQGQILSITGKTPGYESLRKAEFNGLFHPNCRHAINAIIPALAKQTRAYDPITQKLTKPGATLKKAVSKAVSSNVLPAAKKYNKQFQANVEKVAAAGGWEFKSGPLKQLERTVEKVVNDYDADIAKLKDVNRAVVFINDPSNKKELAKMESAVKDVFGNVTVKSNLDAANGYKKAMLNVTTPSGLIAEVQVTTKEMWFYKIEGGGDVLYTEARSTVSETAKERLVVKMDKLYARADAEAAARLSQ